MLCLQSQWFSHSFTTVRVPSSGALSLNGRETYGHRPRSPTWTEGLHTMGCGLVPQPDCFQHCYLYPSAMQPSARYLPPCLGYTRAPLANVCSSSRHQDMLYTTVTASQVTLGTDPRNPEVRTGVWIYGRQRCTCWSLNSLRNVGQYLMVVFPRHTWRGVLGILKICRSFLCGFPE
jgi:hypothetical protein